MQAGRDSLSCVAADTRAFPCVAHLAWLVVVVPTTGWAHDVAQAQQPTISWTTPVWLLLPGVVLLVLYGIGLVRMWHRAGIGHGLSGAELGAFMSAVLVLFLCLVWPLDSLGEWSLAAHMGQHMLLLAVAPPLLLLGRLLAMLAQALPGAWSQWLHRAGHGPWRKVTLLLAPATLVHCAVMLVWHLPAATTAALASEPVHWAMHGSFLIAGLWFWAALLRRVREPRTGVGPALVAIVTVMMSMGLLGALLVFARRPLYPIYVERVPQLGLEAMADQQLAGLIMWVPAALPYVIGGLALAAWGLRWMQRSDRTSASWSNDAPVRTRQARVPASSGHATREDPS